MKMSKRYYILSGKGTPEFDYDTKIPFKFRGVDLIDGITYDIDGYDDLKNNAIVFKCRYCNAEYSWDKKKVPKTNGHLVYVKNVFWLSNKKALEKNLNIFTE